MSMTLAKSRMKTRFEGVRRFYIVPSVGRKVLPYTDLKIDDYLTSQRCDREKLMITHTDHE